MAKGPIITNEIKVLIAKVHREHPKWKAPEVQREVSYIVRKDNPKLPSGWPHLSAVQKVLAIVRKPHLDPQDKPWSMAALDDYPIPPEVIPTVLKCWKYRVTLREHEHPAFRTKEFTIRDAKWVARLSGVITETSKLFIMARAYASLEFDYESISRPFNSLRYDYSIMGMQVPSDVLKESYPGMEATTARLEKGLKEVAKRLSSLNKEGTE